MPVAGVAAAGKGQQPAPQRRIKTRRDIQRRIGLQGPAERAGNDAGRRERWRMRWRDRAAVAMRGPRTYGARLEDANRAALKQKRQRTG